MLLCEGTNTFLKSLISGFLNGFPSSHGNVVENEKKHVHIKRFSFHPGLLYPGQTGFIFVTNYLHTKLYMTLYFVENNPIIKYIYSYSP